MITLLDVAPTNTLSSTLQVIWVLLLFAIVLFGAYYTTKVLTRIQLKQHKNSNIKIVEAISVGPQKTLQLIKVGDEYVLIGVTKDQITFIKEISGEGIDLRRIEEMEQEVPVPFSKYLDKVLKKKTSDKKTKE